MKTLKIGFAFIFLVFLGGYAQAEGVKVSHGDMKIEVGFTKGSGLKGGEEADKYRHLIGQIAKEECGEKYCMNIVARVKLEKEIRERSKKEMDLQVRTVSITKAD